MSKFDIIKKKQLPEDAQIKGLTFLKEVTDKNKDKFDFIEKINGVDIGCFSFRNKKFGLTRGYVKTGNSYLEVKSRFFIFFILLFALLVLLCLLRSCCPDTPVPAEKPIFDLTPDNNAEIGKLEGKSEEELQEELNKKVEEGMMNISMNLNPIFTDGESEGNLLIMNEDVNRHPQIIEIYRKDTNELIYKSGLIPVGSRVDNAKLLVDLDSGEYPCIAYFNGVNGETGQLMGKAGAEILITVQH